MDYPFRVQSPATSLQRLNALRAQGAVAPAEPQAGADATQQYLARILKLIPAEVITLYQGLHGTVATAASAGDAAAKAFLGFMPWLGLAMVVFVRCWGTRDATGSWKTVQAGAVFVASVSFAIWVISLHDPIAGTGHLPNGQISPWIGSTLLMTWPFFVPYFYKGT